MAMAHVTHPVQLVSYRTDWRYPPESMERLREAIPGARHTTLESQLGHGAWLFETGSLGEVVREFME